MKTLHLLDKEYVLQKIKDISPIIEILDIEINIDDSIFVILNEQRKNNLVSKVVRITPEEARKIVKDSFSLEVVAHRDKIVKVVLENIHGKYSAPQEVVNAMNNIDARELEPYITKESLTYKESKVFLSIISEYLERYKKGEHAVKNPTYLNNEWITL